MRLGIFGYWTMARGQGVVNQRLYQALTELGYEVHILSRPCEVNGQRLQDTTGLCAVPHLRLHGSYAINPNTLQAWATHEKLHAVLFAEEMNFALPLALQKVKIKTLQWVDAYMAPSWRLLLKAYDGLWCITRRAESILLDWGRTEQTRYIGWGVPPAMFADAHPPIAPRFDFCHVSGWGGLDMRKGLDLLLAAMMLMPDPPEVLIHCQVPELQMKQILGYESWPPHVIWEHADVPPPGLYGLGRAAIQVSKIEGIGLSIIESLCSGRPTVTTDHPPMNEFVNAEVGWLLPVVKRQPHIDGSLFEQTLISPEDLAYLMQNIMALPEHILAEKSRLCLKRAHEIFAWDLFKRRIHEGLRRLEMTV